MARFLPAEGSRLRPEQLVAEWRVHRASHSVESVMRFADVGLVLGAGTVLLRAGPSRPETTIDVSDPRLLALLAAAHLRSPTALGLAHIGKAANRWREGNNDLASMHLALSGLGRLERPSADAHRLFLADRLLDDGVGAETIIKALDLNVSTSEGVSKYSPDQPRVPAGSGRASGQWAPAGASPTNPSAPQSAQSAVRPASRGASRRHLSGRTSRPHQPVPQARLPTNSSLRPAVQSQAAGKAPVARSFSIELPLRIVGAAVPPPLRPFGQAVKAVADAVEIADSINKWRELGPKGEAAILAAVVSKGWIPLGQQVYVHTTLGLRVEDLMVYVAPGTAGNATGYDGFIEVKVNGGRYSTVQQAKDALIRSEGGRLLTPIEGYKPGQRIFLDTGLANVTIRYEPQ